MTNTLMVGRSVAQAKVRACRACGLRGERTPEPFEGPVPAKVAVVGESPRDDDYGLFPMLSKAGIDPAVCLFANTVSCRPPDSRPPRPEETRACEVHLWRALDLARPRFVLLLGASALRAVDPSLKMSRDRGRMFSDRWRYPYPPLARRRVYFPTWQPTAALRGNRAEFERDIVRFGAMVKMANPWVMLPKVCACGDEGFADGVDMQVKCLEHGGWR